MKTHNKVFVLSKADTGTSKNDEKFVEPKPLFLAW